MGSGTRQISFHELSDKLRQLERAGAAVPQLQLSNDAPEYIETRADGAEIYRHGQSRIIVGSEEVIDSYGNVVDLGRLWRTAFLRQMRETETNIYLGEY